MENPFFTIIIPTYNRANLLSRAISSIINQTFADWELIVVDDESTDNTKEVVLSFKDKRVHYLFKKNEERSAARNAGIEIAKGEYICFLDNDDYFMPERLQLLYEGIKNSNNELAFYYTGICFEHNGIITPRKELKNDFGNNLDFIIKAIIGNPQACIYNKILKKHKYNPLFNIGEDMELWIRIANEFPMIYLDKQFTVIATEHEDRSVNEKKYNPGPSQLRTIKHIFSKNHPGKSISEDIKKQRLSDTYFSIARHYMYNDRKVKAILNLGKSILHNPFHVQTKHKLYLIINLILNKKIEEYQSNR